jgi:TRAP-type C4-dicarboxylate transport system permease small subunit
MKERFMDGFLQRVERLLRFLYILGGASLIFIMSLTIADVFLRLMNRPIVGTYELVCFGSALVIGFAFPYVSWKRGHIFVDFMINVFPRAWKNGFNLVTRCMGIAFFILAGWNLIQYALDLYRVGEVSPTLTIPYYPFIFVVGICCFFQCLSLLGDLAKIWGGRYE